MPRLHKTVLIKPISAQRDRVRLKIMLPLVVGLALLTVVAVAVRNNQYDSYVNNEAAERGAVISQIVQHDFHENAALMSALLQGVAGRRELAEAYLAGDRELLQARASSLYDQMRSHQQVSHFYFYDLDGRVFLRMHKPESFGDVIKRETLLTAKVTGEPIDGFERGPFAAFAQRSVWPWVVDGARIGYLELSMDLDQTASGLSTLMGVELFAVVDKTQVNRDAWEEALKKYGRQGDWDEFENVVVMDRTTQDLEQPVIAYLSNPADGAGHKLLELGDSRALVAQTIPLSDLSGEPLARLVVFTDISDVKAEHDDSVMVVFITSSLVSLLLFGVFFIFSGRVEQALQARRRALEQTNAALELEVGVRRDAEAALKHEQTHLEIKVQARTQELQAANQALKSEIAARAQVESDLNLMFTSTPDMLALGGFDGFFKRVNPSMAAFAGYNEQELLTIPFNQFVDPAQAPAVSADMQRLARGEEVRDMYLRIRHKAGHYLETEWHNVPFLDRGQFLTVGRDISRRKEAERRLIAANDALKAEVEARMRTEVKLDQLFTASQDFMSLADMEGRIVRANPSLCAALGYAPEELHQRPFADLVPSEELPVIGERMARLAQGETLSGIVTRIRTKDGGILHTQWNLVPLTDSGMLYATGRDITERMKLEASLRSALTTLRDAQRIGKVGNWDVDLATGASEWSDETYRIYGFTPGEVTPDMDFFFSMVHPDDREKVRQNGGQTPRNGEHYLAEHRIVRRDGSVRDLLNNLEFVCAPDGRPLKIFGTCQDITERKQAERKQLKLEEQLRSSQKMEAVGSLAGGIAHDFNNLLSVILSYVGFVLDGLQSGDSRRDDLLEVQRAAERAAALTRQLLAFGRKQVLQPVPLNLNQVTAGMEKMLRRIIGEDVSLLQKLDPALGVTMADPGQIEQVTMNLVVNARDAMPTGGCLTIETANVDIDEDLGATGLKAGPYVMLAVTDTGCGMDKATLARMFEPFFTTKEVGKGTGLGLSTVYGIVKQSGGNVTVYSEPGVGSTFRVYLPRDASSVPPDSKRSTAPLQLLGKETILLVEDEPAVRNGAERILTDAGYSVLTAGNGEEGLRVAESFPGEIDLVITDVVMPKLGGALFARSLAGLRPETRILFMSGYSGDAIAHHGTLDAGTQFIGKPFRAKDLTRKVREVLDSGRDEHSTDPTDVVESRKEAS
jgi:two-component system cell cycle sensor histidine kinase/response regulator CckA